MIFEEVGVTMNAVLSDECTAAADYKQIIDIMAINRQMFLPKPQKKKVSNEHSST